MTEEPSDTSEHFKSLIVILFIILFQEAQVSLNVRQILSCLILPLTSFNRYH